MPYLAFSATCFNSTAAENSLEMGDADVIQDQPELLGPGGQLSVDPGTEHL